MNRSGKEAMKEVDIPTEIIEEILLRLPVKSLLRLKSVCNNWSSLIGSQYFIDRHLRHESNPEWLLYSIRHSYKWHSRFVMNAFDGDERPPPHIDPPAMPDRHILVSLVGPVKGVFCATSHLGLVVLWNPATREIREFPALVPSHYHPYAWYFSLVFGFGLDPLSGDFKLVSLCQQGRRPENSAWVYNLSRGGSWQAVEDADALQSMSYALRSVYRPWCCTFLNGVYHWLISLNDGSTTAILAFDMRTDKFQELIVQLPQCLSEREKLQITAYGESLALLLSRERCAGGEHCVELWVRGGDGVWTKNFTIGPFEHMMLPLCVRNENEEVVLQNTWTSALNLCHVSTHKLRTVGIQAGFLSSIYLYKETLVSTNKLG